MTDPQDGPTGHDTTGEGTRSEPGTEVGPASPVDAAPPAATPAAPPAPGPARRQRVLLAAALAGALVLSVTTVLLVTRSQDGATVASYYRPSSAPMSAARDAGRLLFSYDHRTIDADFAAAKALTTGAFADEYERTTTAVVRPVAVENKAVVEATAVAQALASAEPGRVVALVFVNQVTTSSVVQGEKIDQSRVRMTLVERGGSWLVSKVEAL